MNKLESINQLENTIIFFLSDNGAAAPHEGIPPSNSPLPSNGPFAGFKGESWSGGTKVPMTLTWGARIKGGRICHSMVSSMDIFPTIFEATGINRTTSQPIDGSSLIPIINGDNSYSPHKELIWMCQQGDFFTTNPTIPEGMDPSNITDDAPSMAYASFVVRRDQWALRYLLETDTYELYDVKADRQQNKNLFEENKDLAESMTESFKNWYKDMKNPTGWERKYWIGMNEKFLSTEDQEKRDK